MFHHSYNKESFTIEQDVVTDDVVTNTAFQNACARSTRRPNDVHFMNVFEYFSSDNNIFIGIASSKRLYLILNRNTPNETYISQIPDSCKIAYTNDSELHVMKRLLHKVYNKPQDKITYKQLTNSYINHYCDSVDSLENSFVEYLSGDADYMIIGINDIYESKLLEHYYKFFDNSRCSILSHSLDEKINIKLKTMFFNHSLENQTVTNSNSFNKLRNVLSLDELLVTKQNEKYDIHKLEKSESIDYATTQIYMDIYKCEVPEHISSKLQTKTLLKKVIQDTKGSSDSCSINDTKIKNNDDSTNNSYISRHCEATKNMFIDITYPFITDEVDVKLSSLDFTELIIGSQTFDGMVPIMNAIKKDNGTIPRYKINVDPVEYPSDAFINDIYYGAYQNEEHTVLTNAIPFDLDSTKHNIIQTGTTYTIHPVEDSILTATYTTPDSISLSVEIYEGDRIYINANTIFDSELEQFLSNKLQLDDANYYHGYVSMDAETSKLFIELNDIRKPHFIESNGQSQFVKDIQEVGNCFNAKMEIIMDGPKTKEECEKNPENTWDVPCRYNYECPFYGKNKNYKNFFGGCLSSGFCEMPSGIHMQSYKTYKQSPDNKPICYNCNSLEDTDCCNTQNSNLNSPDYMFEYDTVNRIQELYTFKDKNCNLMINKYI
jgi:hypothetical protein